MFFSRVFRSVPPPAPSADGCDILFLLKRRHSYCTAEEEISQSTGLWNSARYVAEMLRDMGQRVAMEIAIDANCIDRLVTLHQPRKVIIEALWVTPEKLAEVAFLHPGVEWCVRIHSEVPFMAGEGMAFGWLHRYLAIPGVSIGINAPRMAHDVRAFLAVSTMGALGERLHYLPNTYPADRNAKPHCRSRYWVDVGCFGAVRPLKNHLAQAIAALEFAMANNRQLRFHINASRLEMNGSPILHNLRDMFDALGEYGHRLVEHDWLPRDDFLALCRTMDLGMQVSFSETFNIVGADLVASGVPLVGSAEIPWLSNRALADPNDVSGMARALGLAWRHPADNVRSNSFGLAAYSKSARAAWVRYVEGV